MDKCMECGGTQMERTKLAEHIEDLGGVFVKLIDGVLVYRCSQCGAEEIEIPNLRGLVRTAAIVRALIPVQLSAGDVRFMRRALDMTQKEFSNAMELAVETVSRWENDAQGVGGFAEKLLRHNVCALLHKYTPAFDYDPADVTNMRIKQLAEGDALQPIELRLVHVKVNHAHEEAWDRLPEAA